MTIPQASAVWDLGFSPARVFDPVTGKDVLTKIEGNKVSIDIHDLPPFEMRYYAVERSDLSAGQAVKCWLNRQLDLWKAVPEVEKPSFKQNPTCPIFLYGKYEVKQFDDESAARKALSSQGNLSDGWTKSFPADWASAGLKQATQLWAVYQKAFEIDPAWLKNLRRAELARTDSRSFWDNVVEIQLNGQVVSSGEKMTNQEKILSLLKPGKNSISILAKADKDGNGGFIGEIVLLRVPGSSDQTVLPLNKEWTVYPSFVDGQVVDLPRSGTWTLARKQVQIPDRFRDCSVWMEVEGKGCVVSTNGRSRYNSNIFGSQIHSQPTLVNITPDIRFGEENEIVLASRYTALKPYPMDLRDVKLIFIPKK